MEDLNAKKDFIVKVHRFFGDENGCCCWDGFYFSKVYAINQTYFLVYDNGVCSASCTEDDFCPDGFNWVDFTETIPDCKNINRRILRVELLEDDHE